MKTKTVNLFGVPINSITMQETIEIIDSAISNGKHISQADINAGKLTLMKKDTALYQSIIEANLINADGIGIVWLSKLCGKKYKIPERVTGIDLMENLVKLAFEKNYKIFLFGARKEVVEKAADIYSKKYSANIIAGFQDGYYRQDEELEIARKIADSGANMLFVAMTSPKKEIFLHQYRDILGAVNYTMGVGGSFDVIAGVVKRAPKIWQKFGFEWLYRFLQEPRRLWRRYLIGNIKFLILSLKFLCNRNYVIMPRGLK